MARTFTLALRGKHVANFSQVKILWAGLQQLEDTKVLGEHLLLVDRRPEARIETVELTYARLTKQLSELGRADIRDARDPEPLPIKYGIWAKEMNVVDMSVLMEIEG